MSLLSVCLFGTHLPETAEPMWLKFYTRTDIILPRTRRLAFLWRLPRGSRQGSRKCSVGRYCISLAWPTFQLN